MKERGKAQSSGQKESRANQLLDELLAECETPEDVLGQNGLLKDLTKRLLERAMDGELSEHLGYDKNDSSGNGSGNSRNGKSKKTIKGEFGEVTIETPRDRNGSYEPDIIKKHQSRFTGFDDAIISMYSRGMTTREISGHLEDIYGVEVSADLISNVTAEVLKDVSEWQSRPLDSVYPIVYLDALFIKVRESGQVKNRAIYLAIGVNMKGLKEVLGIWTQDTEGAAFWHQVLADLNNRGVKDILIACVDGLKGFPDAIRAVFPETQVQHCIVHLVRNSTRFVTWKERRTIAAELKEIYRSPNAKAARQALDTFAEKWDPVYPMISKSWNEKWDEIVPFLAYPEDIRRAIYTTNAIESLNSNLRKVTRNRGAFPNVESAEKILYLAVQRLSERWTMPIKEWGKAINQFAILFEGRVPME